MKQIVIINPFRAGSTSVHETLKKYSHFNVSKFHTYSEIEQKSVPPENIDALVLIYRKPIDLYISAYFSDCWRPEYPYYCGTREQVLAAPIQDLIKHFKSFKWETFGWLNYDYYIDILNKIFNVDKKEIYSFMQLPDKHKICVGQHKSKFVVVILLKTPYLDDSIDLLNTVFNINIKKMDRHQAQKSWCVNKYTEFIHQFNQSKTLLDNA